MRARARPEGPGRRQFLQGLGAAGLVCNQLAFSSSGPDAKMLRGVFPIGQTPFTPDNKLDLDGLAAEVRFCNRGGVHGFAWPQIASGWTNLSQKERLEGAEAILAANRGGSTALVIGVQTKEGDVAGAVEYAKHAMMHGADAIISLPPAKAAPEAILDYYKQLGKAIELPLFILCKVAEGARHCDSGQRRGPGRKAIACRSRKSANPSALSCGGGYASLR